MELKATEKSVNFTYELYGLDVATSDTDIKGVFLLPRNQYLGLDYIPQVSDASNDTVYYELGRYIELLEKNNPNILELLATPADRILLKHPLLDILTPDLFLSKRCKKSFAGYAFVQVKKARGLNKKIVNPVEKEKKTVLHFCYVLQGQGSLPLLKWLEQMRLDQKHCGLVNIPHAKNTYAIFVDPSGDLKYRGIMKKEAATSVLLSSIPKGEKVQGHLHFNEDAYMNYCKEYRDYWDWVGKRNEARYENNVKHGKNYDSKNMMHTFRLLDMALEILEEGVIKVKRPNRTELLAIRNGEWEYDDLLSKADEKMEAIEEAYKSSTLPERPDRAKIEQLLIKLRLEFYKELN